LGRFTEICKRTSVKEDDGTMNRNCSAADLESSWSLAGVSHLSVRRVAKLAGVSRGTAHLHRKLYRQVKARFPRLRVEKIGLREASLQEHSSTGIKKGRGVMSSPLDS